MNFLKNSKQTIFFILVALLLSFSCSHAMKRGREEVNSANKRLHSEFYEQLLPIINGDFPQARTLTSFLQQLQPHFTIEDLKAALTNSETLSTVTTSTTWQVRDPVEVLRQIYLDSVRINCKPILQCFNEITFSDFYSTHNQCISLSLLQILFSDIASIIFFPSEGQNIELDISSLISTSCSPYEVIQDLEDDPFITINIDFIIQLMEAELESGNYQRFPQMYRFLQKNLQNIDQTIITHPLLLMAIKAINNIIENNIDYRTILDRILEAIRNNATELRLSFQNINDETLKIILPLIATIPQPQLLDLNSNRLTALPDSIGNLAQLQELNLARNRLTQLPDNFGDLIQLQKLNLSGNQLTQLPDNFGKLIQLQKLFLSDNHLTQLPDNFGDLIQLQKLNLFNNQLTRLPVSFDQLSQLQRLDLSGNQLTQLPDNFGNLTQLQILDLFNNQLTQLPDSIGNLAQLQILDLSDNHLTQLPDSFGKLIRLRTLFTSNNPLPPNLQVSYYANHNQVQAFLQQHFPVAVQV